MKITYYEVSDYGNIHECSINTEDKKYVSHTDTDVTFNDTYTDQYWEVHDVVTTRSRIFETVRQERIVAYKEEIARYQKDLQVFENATSYGHYWQLLGNLIKK